MKITKSLRGYILRASPTQACVPLSEVVELDEGFFSTEISDAEKDKPLKRGRGSQKKSAVLVYVKSNLKNIRNLFCQYISKRYFCGNLSRKERG